MAEDQVSCLARKKKGKLVEKRRETRSLNLQEASSEIQQRTPGGTISLVLRYSPSILLTVISRVRVGYEMVNSFIKRPQNIDNYF